jgi:hypothetical protein
MAASETPDVDRFGPQVGGSGYQGKSTADEVQGQAGIQLKAQKNAGLIFKLRTRWSQH